MSLESTRVLPARAIDIQTYSYSAVNYAKVFGMEKAMGLKGQQFSTAASIVSGRILHTAHVQRMTL